MAGGIYQFCIVLTEKAVARIECEWRVTEAEVILEEKLVLQFICLKSNVAVKQIQRDIQEK